MIRDLRRVGCDVSRETLAALEHFSALLAKWNKRINLVAPRSLPFVWERHILDSAQIYPLGASGGMWLDLGSGGGLPGIVCAVLAKEAEPGQRFLLVESDQRKATFLRTAIRELDLNARVTSERIERLEPAGAGVISARALAPLTDLLAFVERHGAAACIGIFPKGAQVEAEIAAALDAWHFTCEKIPSATSAESHILKVGDVRRA